MDQVRVCKTIRVGHHVNMHPSEGYQGISSGIVEVIAIHDVPAMDLKCHQEAVEFIDQCISIYDPVEDADDISNTTEHYMDQPWVEYQYTRIQDNNNSMEEVGVSYYLPSDLFANHTTQY